MAKAIGIAVVGYIIISILMFLLLTGAWFAVGVNGAFQPDVWDVTPTWLALLNPVIGAVGVMLGARFGSRR